MNRSHRTQRAPRPPLVLFDLDETLFDEAFARRRGLAAIRRLDPALRRRSLDWLWAEYGRLLNETHRLEVMHGVSRAEARRTRFRRLARSCGTEWSTARAAELADRYREAYARSVRPVPGARALLNTLRRSSRIGVVTNNRAGEQEQKLRDIGLADRVDFMVVSEAVGVWKPDPEIFRIALARARSRADEAVMIGDSWDHDVRGAVAAGIRPVWFDRYRRDVPDDPAGVPVVRALAPAERVLRAIARPRYATTGSEAFGPSPSR